MQMPGGPRQGVGNFLFFKRIKVLTKICFIFERMTFDYNCLNFWPKLRSQDHFSDPDAYALLENIKLCGFYILHINTLMQFVYLFQSKQ